MSQRRASNFPEFDSQRPRGGSQYMEPPILSRFSDQPVYDATTMVQMLRVRPLAFEGVEMGLARHRDSIGVFAWIDAIPIHHNQRERAWNTRHDGVTPLSARRSSLSARIRGGSGGRDAAPDEAIRTGAPIGWEPQSPML